MTRPIRLLATAALLLGLPAPAAAQRSYRNCTEARAAGAAPIRRGEPGYGPHLDRDGDGIACETGRARGGRSGARTARRRR